MSTSATSSLQPMIDTAMSSIGKVSPGDYVMMKMENDTIMSIAQTRGRDMPQIVAYLRQIVETFPEFADQAIYSKPVGTVISVRCANKNCGHTYEVARLDDSVRCDRCGSAEIAAQKKVMKYAEGLSIRAAEILRQAWKYTRLDIQIDELGEDRLKLTGKFTDLCDCNVTSLSRIVSPWIRRRSGQVEKIPEDRFLGVVVKAESAKLIRDIILGGLPYPLKAQFRDLCEKKLAELVTHERITERVVPKFAEKGITLTHLEQIVGRPVSAGWTRADLMMLHKLWQALETEETTVEEILAGISSANEKNSTGKSAVSDLLIPAVAVEQPKKKQHRSTDAAAETERTTS